MEVCCGQVVLAATGTCAGVVEVCGSLLRQPPVTPADASRSILYSEWAALLLTVKCHSAKSRCDLLAARSRPALLPTMMVH
jgi:hypothetical protein